jgi:hypothetical protein
MGCAQNCRQCSRTPCTCSSNFWILKSGENKLKGCECDPCNPVRLQDVFILCALQQSQKARDDFCKLYPALFPCEKERFDLLFRDNPHLTKILLDPTKREDMFQGAMNKRIPVYTAGKLGGRRLNIGRVAQTINLPPHLLTLVQPKGCGNG